MGQPTAAQRSALEILRSTLFSRVDPDDVDGVDPELIQRIRPLIELLVCRYFRLEVEGIERVPTGPAILVGNHNSGISFVEPFGMGARWYAERQADGDVLHTMVHDALMAAPLLGSFLWRLGALRGSRQNALAVLAAGQKVLVFPGGELESFRPFWQRHQIRFNGRRGFVRLALQARAPIVPLVTIGGHEGFFVLNDGAWLARLLRLDTLLRNHAFAISLCIPWGLALGPMFHLPLPTKIRFRFLEPLDLSDYRPEQADEPATVEEIYRLVVQRMQQAMTELARQRRYPIIG